MPESKPKRKYVRRSELGRKWYNLWYGITRRCYDSSHPFNHLYRDRQLHPEWVDNPDVFGEYIERELGDKPSPKHSLDRIDNTKGYVPGNLRWATQKEQMNNTQVTRWFEWDGETRNITELAEIARLPRNILSHRLINLKWPLQIAMTTPLVPVGQRHLYGKALTAPKGESPSL